MNNIELLGHSGIKISGEKIIYIDPYKVKNPVNDADYIFITHSHYDHYSPEDILKIKKDNSIIIATTELKEEILNIGFDIKNILLVKPENEYELDTIKFSTVFSYNISKNFHPKGNEWVGYIIDINNTKYYIAGDTDFTDEIKNVKCDVAFVPVGGTYTMDYKEAAKLVNTIKPDIVFPIHYGSIVGSREDAENFSKMLNTGIKFKIML